jgi:hypothetical protein
MQAQFWAQALVSIQRRIAATRGQPRMPVHSLRGSIRTSATENHADPTRFITNGCTRYRLCRLSLGHPAVEVRTHPSLVLEEAIRILPLREYVNLRVIPLQPLLEVLVD